MPDTELQFWLAALTIAAGRWVDLRALGEILERTSASSPPVARA